MSAYPWGAVAVAGIAATKDVILSIIRHKRRRDTDDLRFDWYNDVNGDTGIAADERSVMAQRGHHAQVMLDAPVWRRFYAHCVGNGITIGDRLAQLALVDLGDVEYGSPAAIARQLDAGKGKRARSSRSSSSPAAGATRRSKAAKGLRDALRSSEAASDAGISGEPATSPSSPARSPAKGKANTRSSAGVKGRPTRRRSS